MNKNRDGKWLNPCLTASAVILVFLSCLVGPVKIQVLDILTPLFGQANSIEQTIIFQIRLPRALSAFFVGLALGASGAALQGLLRNPLAEPGVLGVSASASLGATCVLYFGYLNLAGYALPMASIIGALTATALIAITAIYVRSITTLILFGVGLSSFSGAAMALLLNFAPNPFFFSDLANWLLGSVANRTLNDLYVTVPFLFAGIGILLFAKRGLGTLTLGEEAAVSIGLNLQKQRILIVLGTGLATGSAVALAGIIGFIGIVIPHIIRPFVGYDPGRSVLPSALLAGVFLTLADIGIKLIHSDSELKLGVVSAIVGAPIFIWIALKRGAEND